ncbi:MAG: hypothetical protein ABI488_06235 [Polyangiaceae bacterium]
MLKVSSACAASLAFLSLSALLASCSSSSDAPSAGGGAGGGSNAGANATSGAAGDVSTGGSVSAAGADDSPVGGAAGAAGAVEPAGDAGAAGGPTQASLAVGPKLEMGNAVCGITQSGAAYCWGYSANGETGVQGGTPNVPNPVQGGLTFSTISTYRGHTCALTPKGAAYCWGDGSFNALGDGLTNGHLVHAPVAVTGGLKFAAITAGDNFTCALTDDGTAYCFGDNRHGELGLGADDSTARVTATKVPTLKWQSISAREKSICGISSAGAAYCWGANGGVQGAGGSPTEFAATPTLVPGGALLKVVVTASTEHACGLTADGHAYCWGSGALGDGMAGGVTALAETAVAGDHAFTRIAGALNTFCGVTAAGATYCWGGAFGNTPTLSFDGIVAGEVATRGVATCVVSTVGTAYCLGSNFLGELGDGTNAAHSVATPVSGDLKFQLP